MRREGLAKLSGQTRFLADLPMEGALWGGTVRSPAARGRIRAIRFDPAVDWSQFVRVDYRDIPGRNAGALFDHLQPVLAVDQTRHVGEPVLLIAHPSRRMLRAALRAVTVVVDERPGSFDFRVAPAAEAAQAGPDNIFARASVVSGDPDRMFRRNHRIIEGAYETGAQEHLYLEPQSMEAALTGDTMTVRGSLQCPSYVQAAVGRVLGPAVSSVRVQVTPVGGGFGGKEDYPSMIAAHASLLALAAGRAVRIIYDRPEDMVATSRRHAARIRHRTAVARDGELLAMEIDVLLDGGAYATLSPIVLERAVVHATGPYRCRNVRVEGAVRMTNTLPAGAFRGFGNPQVHFAVERHMDRIADTLGLDPAALRRRNLLRDGDTLPSGDRIADGVDAAGLLDQALRLAGHDRKQEAHRAFNQREPWRRRGMGCAMSFHGTGLPKAEEARIGSRAEVEATSDGGVLLKTSIVEMGQGVATVFADLAAGILGLRPEEVEIVEPDTEMVPDTGPSVASRTSMVAGLLVERACRDLLTRLELPPGSSGDQVRAAIRDRARAEERIVGRASYQGESREGGTPDPRDGGGYAAYGWAAQVAEVEVDLRSGMTQLLDIVSVQDVGTVLNHGLAAGQVQGGVAQAAGWALSERVVLGPDGAMTNRSLADYVIPTAADLPAIRVAFVETPSAHGARGARGLGELPMVGAGAAVVNAVSRAVQGPIDRLPALPEEVLAAIELAETGSHDRT